MVKNSAERVVRDRRTRCEQNSPAHRALEERRAYFQRASTKVDVGLLGGQ